MNVECIIFHIHMSTRRKNFIHFPKFVVNVPQQ